MGILNFFKKNKHNSEPITPDGNLSEQSEILKKFSESLSAAASQQSSAVHETVSSISEMRSMLYQTDQYMNLSIETTERTTNLSQESAQTIAKLERAMNSILESNKFLDEVREIFKNIESKTKIINEIVFKTQLLSFNASIEASRAGQYGKGFAVVAEEVGRLAQTSGRAAKEIQSLLSDSLTKVNQVVDLVVTRSKESATAGHEAKKSFDNIQKSIQEISKALKQMSSASHEQLHGVDQITRAMEQINISAQENKKAAEEILKISNAIQTNFNVTVNQPHNLDVIDWSNHNTEIENSNIISLIDSVVSKDKNIHTINDSKENPITADDPTFKSKN